MNKLHVIADQNYNWPIDLAKFKNMELNFVMAGESCSPLYWLDKVFDIDYKKGDKVIGLIPSAERDTKFKDVNNELPDADRTVHLTAIDPGIHQNVDRIQFISSVIVKALHEFSKDKDAYFYLFQDQIYNHNDGYHLITDLKKYPSINFVEELDPRTIGGGIGLAPMTVWLAKYNNIPLDKVPLSATRKTYTDEAGRSLFTTAILKTLPETFFY